MTSEKFTMQEVEQFAEKIAKQYDIDMLSPVECKKLLNFHLKYTDFTQPRSLSLALLGETGIGKTSIVKQVTADQGMSLITVRAANIHEGHIDGYPTPSTRLMSNGDSNTSIDLAMLEIYAKQINKAVSEGKKICIFFDELNRAKPSIVKTVFNIIDEKIWAGKTLPADTAFVVSVNPASDAYSVDDIFGEEAALMARFKMVGMKADVQSYLKFMESKDFHPVIVKYVKKDPTCLSDFGAMNDGHKFSCPAILESISTTFKNLEKNGAAQDQEVLQALMHDLQASIGKSRGGLLAALFERHADKIDVLQILRNFNAVNEKLGGLDEGELSSLAEEMGQHLGSSKYVPTDSEAQNLAHFLNVLKPEIVQAFLESTRTQMGAGDEALHYIKELNEQLLIFPEYRKIMTDTYIKADRSANLY